MYLRGLIASTLLLVVPAAAVAQTKRETASVAGIVGHAAFLDEDPVDHFILGGAARFRLSPRVSVGPEVVYMIGPDLDRDLFVTGNVWFSLVGPGEAGLRRVTPYLVAGAGLMRHHDRFIPDFTAREWAFTGGVGVRIALNERWYIAPEARLGWEAHSRLNAIVGYRLGGS